jgi:hypothetical protein
MAARANRTTPPKGAAQAKRAAQSQPGQSQPGQPGKQSQRAKKRAALLAAQAAGGQPAGGQPANQPADDQMADAQAVPAVPSALDDLPAATAEPAREPKALQLAAAAQGIEAIGVAVAGVFAAVSTVDGRSYTTTNGVALTLFLFVIAACGVALAVGLSRVQPWSRVPAALTQLVVIAAGIALLDGHRPEWGVPALALAAACLVGLFTPASLKALNRQLD